MLRSTPTGWARALAASCVSLGFHHRLIVVEIIETGDTGGDPATGTNIRRHIQQILASSGVVAHLKRDVRLVASVEIGIQLGGLCLGVLLAQPPGGPTN